jgi:co-chaperonin GroES (HSP10)
MYKPLGNNLFVEPMHRLKSDGGIHLIADHTYNQQTVEYVVLAVGPGRVSRKGTHIPIFPEIRPGDTVIARAYVAKIFEVMVEGVDHKITVIDAGEVLIVTGNVFDSPSLSGSDAALAAVAQPQGEGAGATSPGCEGDCSCGSNPTPSTQ